MFLRVAPHILFVFSTIVVHISCQKTSLTFVIDDTGSMWDDISQVRKEVDAIMDIVLEEKSSQISNIVLATFNDPWIHLRTVTTNRRNFKQALSNIIPNDGDDCPEMALKGIKLALEKSLPGSFVYVFTDASAKDYWMSDEIQQLCQRKQSQVVFVLTGDCGNPNSKMFRAYYDIATASAGLAFRLDKSEVTEVLHTIRETIKGNKTVLATRTTSPGVYTNVPFTVDDQTEYVIVSASGTDVELIITSDVEQEKIMWTQHGKVIKVIRPKPGTYVATVKSSSTTSVVIVGRSDFIFRHGFSELKPKSLDDTTPQPFSDTLTHLSVLVTDPKHTVRIQEAQIMNMKESVTKILPLTELTPDFYTTELFIAPSEMFKIAVKGEDIHTSKPIIRKAKIPVTPQKPPMDKPVAKKPIVNIKEGTSIGVAAGRAVTLTCEVAAYPKPEITWRNIHGITLASKSSTKQIPYDYISYLEIPEVSKEARYYCHATNIVGIGFKAIDVVIKDPFTIGTVPEGTTKIQYGTEFTLNCNIKSQKPLNIRWYRENKLTGKTAQILSSELYSISADNTQLKIKSMNEDLQGKYTCKAYLIKDPTQNREFSTNVEILGLVPPKIDANTQIIKVTEHKSAVIKCRILEGVPKPKISWQFKSSGSASHGYQPIAGSSAELRISSTQLDHAGFYKCVAVNSKGRDEQTVAEVMVLKAPAVIIEEGEAVTVQYGSRLTLKCKVSAYPAPTVTWTDDEGNILPSLISQTENNYEYTYTVNSVKQSRKYACRAENNQGSKTQSILVTVPSPFTVHSQPPNTITATYGSSVNLKCDIKSHMPMKIKWYFASASVSGGRQLSSSDKYEISADGAELRIKSMDVDLPGTYTCKAVLINDPHESKSFTTNIHIEGLEVPKITGDGNIKARLGASVSIKCNIIKGVPKPAVSWQFTAAGGDKFEAVAHSGSVLRIDETQRADAGRYKCTARNSEGAAEHITLLTVEEPAKILTDASKEYDGLVGDLALRIPCDAVGNPKPTIEWRVKGTLITPGAKYATEDGALIIKNPELKDSTSYTCTAANYLGSDTKTFTGVVYETLENYGDTHKLFVLHKNPMNLTCNLLRSDTASVKWFKEGVLLNVIKPYFYVEQPSIMDSGNYTCHVTDAHGSATETYEVDVGYPPTFKNPQNGLVYEWEGDPEDVLDCLVTAQPQPKAKWTYNGVPIEHSTIAEAFEMRITKQGHYTCVVSNVHGVLQRDFEVKLTGPSK